MRSLIILTVMFCSQLSNAGDKIGNGGGAWVCHNFDKTIRNGYLVDIYEARNEFGLTINESFEANPFLVVDQVAQSLKGRHPVLHGNLMPALNDVIAKLRMVVSELVVVDDALFRLKPLPESCPTPWQYVQFANYTNLGQVLVRADIWKSLAINTIDKAALIWHEAIYQWLRVARGDKDSVRARLIVGLLFANLPNDEFQKRVDEVLKEKTPVPNPSPGPQPLPDFDWVCIQNNTHESQWFMGYGINEIDAKGEVNKACEKGSNGFFCDQVGLKCEQIKGVKIAHVCTIENSHEGSTFSGRGRSLLEAEGEARVKCSNESKNRFFCSGIVTCQ